MDFSSLHVCIDSSDHWLQSTMNEESSGKESLSSGASPICGGGGENMLVACNSISRPIMTAERRLRPPHDQALKCPRCDSTHTKFCYYNNYSLSQPRYFCKTCRRYWTKGGTLRNIPVGGGCRKNKKVSSKTKPNNNNNNNNNNEPTTITHHHQNMNPPFHNNNNPKDLQLSFPDVQFSHLNNLVGSPSFMESKYNLGILDHHRPIDFMESSTIIRNHHHNSRNNFDFFEMSVGGGCYSGSPLAAYSGAFGGNNNNSNSYIMQQMDVSCQQRLMLPYDDHCHHNNLNESSSMMMDVKPNPKVLSLEWQEQGCSDAGKDSSFGYLNGYGSLMNNAYGSSSTTNPLV